MLLISFYASTQIYMNNYIINFDYFKKNWQHLPYTERLPTVFKPANIYNNHKPIDTIGNSYIQPNIYRNLTSIEMHKWQLKLMEIIKNITSNNRIKLR
jgi:hypothetical protein